MSPSRNLKARPAAQRVPKEEVVRAIGALITQLPRLPTDPAGGIDFPASAPDLLVKLADNAETTVGVINLGVSAIGNLLAYAAPEIEDGTVSSDSIEALGWLLAELGDLAARCTVLGARCRRETVDYEPPR